MHTYMHDVVESLDIVVCAQETRLYKLLTELKERRTIMLKIQVQKSFKSLSIIFIVFSTIIYEAVFPTHAFLCRITLSTYFSNAPTSLLLLLLCSNAKCFAISFCLSFSFYQPF